MTLRRFETFGPTWEAFLTLCLVSGVILLMGNADSAASYPIRGGQVEGIVVTTESGMPVQGAEVWLDRVAETDLAPRRRAVTNEAGAFVFTRVHPGQYRLYARKGGYTVADYLFQIGAEAGAALVIEEGTHLSNLQIALPLGARVSGVVWDEVGQPAAEMIVKLLALTPSGDGVSTTSILSTKTNDTGQYELDGLPPGQYVVRAERRNIDQSRALLEFAYYPDTDSWQTAIPLELNPGDALSEVNIMFAPHFEQPVMTGMVTDALTGQPLEGVSIDLVDGANLGLRTKTTAEGIFRLEGMPAGRYAISVHGDAVGDGYAWKMEWVSLLPGENLLDFQLMPAPLIIAAVEYVGSGSPPKPGDYMVSVRIDDNARGLTFNGQEAFQFRGLKSGRARIGVGFAALQYELMGIFVGGQDLTGQTFDLHPGDKLTDVRILITDNQGAELPIQN